MNRKYKSLLITGFEPFGGETINPSWEAVSSLPDVIGSFQITKLKIPVTFDQASQTILTKASEIHPDVILCIGQAGGRSCITPEVIAINLRHASIPDNAGYQPDFTPVLPKEREAYFSTVPVREIAASLKKENIPAALSYSAGAYVCNDVLYTLLHHYHHTETKVGFIHVPYLPEQVKNQEPSLSLETIIKALVHAIKTL